MLGVRGVLGWLKTGFMPCAGDVLQTVEHIAAMVEPNVVNDSEHACKAKTIGFQRMM